MSGSPPVNTISGSPKERISSSRRYPCSVVSSLRVPLRLGRSAAMHARQVAGLGHFPDHQHGGLIEIHRFSSTGSLEETELHLSCHEKPLQNTTFDTPETPSIGAYHPVQRVANRSARPAAAIATMWFHVTTAVCSSLSRAWTGPARPPRCAAWPTRLRGMGRTVLETAEPGGTPIAHEDPPHPARCGQPGAEPHRRAAALLRLPRAERGRVDPAGAGPRRDRAGRPLHRFLAGLPGLRARAGRGDGDGARPHRLPRPEAAT